jgi:hypothetical protein
LAPTSGDGARSRGRPPRLFVVFEFVLFSGKDFYLARDVFGAVVGLAAATPFARPGTAGTTPMAASPACGTTCVPARCRLRTLVDATRFTTSAGVVGVAGALVAT